MQRAPPSNLGLSVNDRSITRTGSHGVQLGIQSDVTQVRVRWNRLDGMSEARGSTVSGNNTCNGSTSCP